MRTRTSWGAAGALSLLLAPTLLAQESAPAPNAARSLDPAAAPRAPRLSGRVASAATFEIGGGKYEVGAGTLQELVDADGAPMGWFASAGGKLTWTPDDPSGARVYIENAKRVGGVDVKGDALVGAFSAGVFFVSDDLRARLAPEEPAAGSAAGGDGALKAALGRFVADRLPHPGVALAAARREKRPYFQALLVAGKDLRHEYDDALGDAETLTVVEQPAGTPVDFPDWRVPRTIGRRAIGRSRRAAPRVDFRLVDVKVDVREDEGGWGRFQVEETILPQRPLSAIRLGFDSDRLTEHTFRIVSTRLQSVTLADGTPVPHAFERETLTLFFPKPLAAGASVTLSLSYVAPFLARLGGDNYWELPLGGDWYPAPTHAAASGHTFRSVVRTRKPFLAFASGETVRRGEDGDWNLLETKLERPTAFVTILAGKYTLHEETVDGVTCRVASYGVAKPKSSAKLSNLFHLFRKFYEPYFGPFPWKQYDIVEVNSYGYGQAPPGMMRITHEAFDRTNLVDPVAEFFSEGVNERLAHEIAHAWFGHVVWSADATHQWLEEAFSEVAAGRAIEAMKDKADYKRMSNIWKDRGREASSLAPIAQANEVVVKATPGASDVIGTHRYYLTYFKGATLLTEIRKEIGDELFFTVLRSFLRSFEKRPAVTTDQFIGLLEYVTKKDWKPFFEKHYWGTEKL